MTLNKLHVCALFKLSFSNLHFNLNNPVVNKIINNISTELYFISIVLLTDPKHQFRVLTKHSDLHLHLNTLL